MAENNKNDNDNAFNNATALPAQAPSSRCCANPMTANFDPGTLQGQKIFDAKTQGLLENKTFEITTREGAALRKYLLGRQVALGDIVSADFVPNSPAQSVHTLC